MGEHPEACPSWQEDIAAWVVAQLAPARERALEEHLASCPACRAEADSLLAVSAVALATEPAPVGQEPGWSSLVGRSHQRAEVVDGPPDGLGERIVGSIQSERRARRVARAAVVALATAAAAVVAVVALSRGGEPAPLDGEQLEFSVVPAGASAHSLVCADDERCSVVQLTATGLDPEVTYALWLSPPAGTWDDRIAAGTFRPEADGTVDVRLRCAMAPDEYGRAWATTPDGTIALDTK
jgi:hypothetical protein